MEPMNFDIENTTWWKPDGSDHFTVRSVFFDGAGMQVQTMDGRMLKGDVLQEYIQSDTPVSKPIKPTQTQINKSFLTQGLSNEELGDIFIEDTPKVGSNLNERKIEVPKESENDIIIKRMMDKLGYPECVVNVELKMSDEYVEKLNQSADIMGLNMEEIKNYIYHHFESDKELLYDILLNEFTWEFNRHFSIKEKETPEIVEENHTNSEPKKKSKKK